jgi:Domain of unknown function DUF29
MACSNIGGREISKTNELYERDFFLWTQQQAAALRAVKNSNLPLDWDNLAEEIESLGKSDRRQLRSQIRRILRHLLKLEVSPAPDPRPGWCSTIADSRSEIEDVLQDSPSLRREIDGMIAKELNLAAKFAAADLRQYGEPAEAVWARLEKGGFTVDQLLGDWFPPAPG